MATQQAEMIAGVHAPAAAPEPCPSPLSVAQVVDAFQSESEAWEIDRGAYNLAGRTWGSGPPLYFLNGLLGTHEMFAPCASLLREHTRCVMFDYPGASHAARRTVASLADDLFAVARHHGDERICLFASSFGGLVALTAMLAQPDRISGVILQAGFARRTLSPFERLLARAGRFTPGCVANLPGWRWIQEQNHRPWFPPFDNGRWPFLMRNSGSTPIRDVARRAWLIHRTDLRPRLAEVRQPVLVLRSEGDGRVSARYQDELLADMPNASSESLHSTGRVPYLTHPHRLAKIIRSFLANGL